MPPKFKLSDCAIPQLWCGESATPPKKNDPLSKYYKTGSRYECLKKGIGAGTHIERNKSLPVKSLQQIKYVGETHESNFKKVGIKDTTALVREMKTKTSTEIESILKRVLAKSNGPLDQRAYNSVIVYLYQHGNGGVPACKKISP